MVFAAYMRVFEPLAAFAESEREQWERARADSGEVPVYRGRDRRRRTGLGVHAERPGDGAFVRRVDDTVLVCPWDTRLRETQSALAFRQVFHEVVASAFIPEVEARRAAAELERLQSAGRRSHILVHAWQVPVRWFLPFAPEDRHLVERRHGPGIVYETSLVEGLARVQRALKVLEDVGFDEYRVHQVEELADWLSGFHRRSLVQLDYGTVAELYSAQELATDDSAADAWASLDALGRGDPQLSFQHYSRLTERFGRGRSLAVSS